MNDMIRIDNEYIKWGSAFFDTLSEDLKKMFPGAKGILQPILDI